MNDVDGEVVEGLKLRQFQLYAMFGSPTKRFDITDGETQAALAAHVEFLRGIEASGTMFMGGPFRAPDYEWDGSGMIIVRADSIDEVNALAKADPLFAAGLRTYELRGWQLNEGRIALTVDLDSNRVDVA